MDSKFTDSDVFTLIGHSSSLRGQGHEDMPDWLLGLAERIADGFDGTLASRVDTIRREQQTCEGADAAPANQRALACSMAELEAFGHTDDRGLTVSEAESIALVLLELKRLLAGGKPAPWQWLQRVIKRIPTRQEFLGGQRTRYVQVDEVLACLEEGEKCGDALAVPDETQRAAIRAEAFNEAAGIAESCVLFETTTAQCIVKAIRAAATKESV